MEIFTWQEGRTGGPASFADWAFIAIITGAYSEGEPLGANKLKPRPDHRYEVEFKIDGVEFSFNEFLVVLERAFDAEVANRAKTLIPEQIAAKAARFDELLDEAAQKIREEFDLPPESH